MKKHLLTFGLFGLVMGLFISAIWLTNRLELTQTDTVKEVLAQGVTYKRTYLVDTPLDTPTPTLTTFLSPTLALPTETPAPTLTTRIIALPRTGVGQYFSWFLIIAGGLVALAFIF